MNRKKKKKDPKSPKIKENQPKNGYLSTFYSHYVEKLCKGVGTKIDTKISSIIGIYPQNFVKKKMGFFKYLLDEWHIFHYNVKAFFLNTTCRDILCTYVLYE